MMDGSESGLPQRKSIRLRHYDYALAGAYFVTICAADKRCIFGKIVGEEMQLNELGQIVEDCWRQIPEHFENAELDEFVIMPNHLHGIIVLRDIEDDSCRDTINRVRESQIKPTTESFGNPTVGSIPTIIRTFKAAVTRESRRREQIVDGKIWQSRFFERIIRNDGALSKAREYIINNPLKWHLDKENPGRDTINRVR